MRGRLRVGRLGALAAWALALVTAAPVRAQDGTSGDWQGQYFCAQGVTAMSLYIRPVGGPSHGAAGQQDIRAVFHFYADRANPGVPEGCFEMSGTFTPGTGDGAAGRTELRAGRWLLQPFGYVTVDLSGTVDGTAMRGQVAGPFCTTFALQRLKAASTPAVPVPAACDPGAAVSALGRAAAD